MELVIFDLDGVIVSTDLYHYRAWKSIADKNNFLFNEEINHMLRGVSRRESLKIILDVNGRKVEMEDFNRMIERKNMIYQESLKDLTSEDILPGFNSLLEDLMEHNIKVAVGSSSKNASLILKQIGLVGKFNLVVDGNDISKSKPHPEVFLKCANSLHIDPSQCVVYEDAEAGIEAAKSAGMLAIGLGRQQLIKADYMVKSLVNESYDNLMKKMEVR